MLSTCVKEGNGMLLVCKDVRVVKFVCGNTLILDSAHEKLQDVILSDITEVCDGQS